MSTPSTPPPSGNPITIVPRPTPPDPDPRRDVTPPDPTPVPDPPAEPAEPTPRYEQVGAPADPIGGRLTILVGRLHDLTPKSRVIRYNASRKTASPDAPFTITENGHAVAVAYGIAHAYDAAATAAQGLIAGTRAVGAKIGAPPDAGSLAAVEASEARRARVRASRRERGLDAAIDDAVDALARDAPPPPDPDAASPPPPHDLVEVYRRPPVFTPDRHVVAKLRTDGGHVYAVEIVPEGPGWAVEAGGARILHNFPKVEAAWRAALAVVWARVRPEQRGLVEAVERRAGDQPREYVVHRIAPAAPPPTPAVSPVAGGDAPAIPAPLQRAFDTIVQERVREFSDAELLHELARRAEAREADHAERLTLANAAQEKLAAIKALLGEA